MTPNALHEFLNFDIDRYLNPYIPHNRFYILPRPISHFLGYRHEAVKEPCVALQWPITILATIAGLCLVSGIGNYAPGILAYHPPVIIASLGASAVLDFNAIRTPLAQPRNSIIGNTLAAICGVCIAKLFQLNPDFENIQWVSAAVGCALASWVMSLTNTIHPPGGATAVLASTEAAVAAMGWKFIPVVLLDSTLLVCVALIFNNIFRQYPVYWWAPGDVGSKLRREEGDAQGGMEEGKAKGAQFVEQKRAESDSASDRTLQRTLSERVDFVEGLESISVEVNAIRVPSHVQLSDEEVSMLENLRYRLWLP